MSINHCESAVEYEHKNLSSFHGAVQQLPNDGQFNLHGTLRLGGQTGAQLPSRLENSVTSRDLVSACNASGAQIVSNLAPQSELNIPTVERWYAHT